MGIMGGTFCVTDIDTCSVVLLLELIRADARGRHTDSIDLHQKVTIQMFFTLDRDNFILHNAHQTSCGCPGRVSVNLQLITSACA